MSTTLADRLLTQGEIEQQIMAVSEALEEETVRYADLSEHAADAEASWNLGYNRSLLESLDAEVRGTADARKARAYVTHQHLYRRSKVFAAREDASKQALYSLRARLDALRTLAANVRAQT